MATEKRPNVGVLRIERIPQADLDQFRRQALARELTQWRYLRHLIQLDAHFIQEEEKQ